jgi:hypothetical protein
MALPPIWRKPEEERCYDVVAVGDVRKDTEQIASVCRRTRACTHKTACIWWRMRYPLYPQKQISQKRESMSAKGQNRP